MAKDIRIGIHGARSSGKSCYLASLYGKQTEGDTTLALPDNDTIELLKTLWGLIESGKQLPANPLAKVKQIPFIINDSGKISRVITADYSGELVQRQREYSSSADGPSESSTLRTDHQITESVVAEVRKKRKRSKPARSVNKGAARENLADDVRRWMHDSDALCIIVDVEDINEATPEELRERQVELGLLFAALQKGKRLTKPLAFLITKWDMISPHLSTQDEEDIRLRTFMNEQHLLSQISKCVELAGKDFHVFPVSAFGANIDGKYPPPKSQARPFNTIAPLAWCVERVRSLRQIVRYKRTRNASIIVAAGLILSAVGIRIRTQMIENKLDRLSYDESPIKPIQQALARYELWLEYQSYIAYWFIPSMIVVVLITFIMNTFIRRCSDVSSKRK